MGGVYVIFEAVFWIFIVVAFIFGAGARVSPFKKFVKELVKEASDHQQAQSEPAYTQNDFSSASNNKQGSGGRKAKSFSKPKVTIGEQRPKETAASYRLHDDRKNDWLARQIREEKRILRTGGLYDLGAVHEISCQAKSLKLAHIIEHDDSIDDAEE